MLGPSGGGPKVKALNRGRSARRQGRGGALPRLREQPLGTHALSDGLKAGLGGIRWRGPQAVGDGEAIARRLAPQGWAARSGVRRNFTRAEN
jgi:hypothetical protein